MKLERIENGFCPSVQRRKYKIIRSDGKDMIVSASELKDLWNMINSMGIVEQL